MRKREDGEADRRLLVSHTRAKKKTQDGALEFCGWVEMVYTGRYEIKLIQIDPGLIYDRIDPSLGTPSHVSKPLGGNAFPFLDDCGLVV
jgi:hypothetical protein